MTGRGARRMKLLIFVILGFAHSEHVPSPIRNVEVTEPINPLESEEYSSAEFQTSTDNLVHGCAKLPYRAESYHCEDVWLKNQFSERRQRPEAVTLDFYYHHGDKDDMYQNPSWRPVTTWIEHLTYYKMRICATTVEGNKYALSKGRIRWLAIYGGSGNGERRHGVIDDIPAMTTGKKCFYHSFGRTQAFILEPHIKFTVETEGKHTVYDAMVVWGKGLTASGVQICMKEFHQFSGYHTNLKIHWFATLENGGTERKVAVFDQGEIYPNDHDNLNHFYCKKVPLPHAYFPCAAVMVQAYEAHLDTCESPTIAWVANIDATGATVCYADERGIMDRRKLEIHIDVIVIGERDQCIFKNCPINTECYHPNDSPTETACSCPKVCPAVFSQVCGTNMVTYSNLCMLEKDACEHDNKFKFAHDGPCEAFTINHGISELDLVDGCGALYCRVISTGNMVWYPDAHINVQASVMWSNNLDDDCHHDATSVWVEDVTPNSFKACVKEAGGKNLNNIPRINWFAYQGSHEHVVSSRMKVGEWRFGTQCVPVHKSVRQEDKYIEEMGDDMKDMGGDMGDMKDMVDDMKDMGDEMNDCYDRDDMKRFASRVLSNLNEEITEMRLREMMKGMHAKKFKLESGMTMNGATFMMTVEHMSEKSDKHLNALNAWLEYDTEEGEAFVCMRDMTKGGEGIEDVYIHWTLFNGSFIDSLGYSREVNFLPSYSTPMFDSRAFCQEEEYHLGLDAVDSATVLVSLKHSMPTHDKGMMEDEMYVMKNEEMASWMLPNMQRRGMSGWKPNRRVMENSQYSAWVEGMNSTHLKVCQMSVAHNQHYAGVSVSLFVLPARCSSGYVYSDGRCNKYESQCNDADGARNFCQSRQQTVVTPQDYVDRYHLSYLAEQNEVFVGKTRSGSIYLNHDGTQVRNLFWVTPLQADTTSNTCVTQYGRSNNYRDNKINCISCRPYACGAPAPRLSCNFPDGFVCTGFGLRCRRFGFNDYRCSP